MECRASLQARSYWSKGKRPLASWKAEHWPNLSMLITFFSWLAIYVRYYLNCNRTAVRHNSMACSLKYRAKSDTTLPRCPTKYKHELCVAVEARFLVQIIRQLSNTSKKHLPHEYNHTISRQWRLNITQTCGLHSQKALLFHIQFRS